MVKVFVNGDSHTAQVYGEGPGRTATKILADRYGCDYENIALAGGSNQRIIRTTQERLKDLDPAETLIIIGWSSFERTEWYYRDHWHQICGDAAYRVDPDLADLWKQHIDSWWVDDNHEAWRRQEEQHVAIWTFHRLLSDLGYAHVFYQGCKTFFFDGCPQQDQPFTLPWPDGVWAHDPYVKLQEDNTRIIESFSHYVENRGCQHVDDRAHYGQDAHDLWAEYLDDRVSTVIRQLKGI